VAQGSSERRKAARPRRGVSLAALAIVCLATAPAFADVTKDQCIDANGKAQDLRRSGKLTAAREQLRVCATSSCPAIVRDDCSKRLDELERAQPTIVFDTKDGAGNDVGGVRLTVDGTLLSAKLDGSALAVDPGEHAFKFEAPGQPAVTKTFIVKEAEKARRERIVLGAATPSAPSAPVEAPAPAAPPSAAPPSAPAPIAAPSPPAPAPSGPSATTAASTPSSGGSGRKTLGLVLGGAGVAGVAVGSVFGLLASSSWNSAKGACSADSCPGSTRGQAQSDHDAAVTDGTVSTIAFVAGGVLVAAGIVLFATAPSGADSSSARLIVAPEVGRDRGGLWLQGRF
jgi:hypothetical protein